MSLSKVFQNLKKKITNNQRGWLLSSLMFNKAVAFAVAAIATNLLTKEMYGKWSYTFAIISMFIPFIGFGWNVGYMRFGALLNHMRERRFLAQYSLGKGLLFTALLMIALLPIMFLVDQNNSTTLNLLLIALFYYPANYLFRHQNIHFQVLGQNEKIAKQEFLNGTLYLILALIFIAQFGVYGIPLAIISSQLIAYLVFLRYSKLKPILRSPKTLIELPKFKYYSINASVSIFLSQAIFQLDTFMVSYLLGDESTAEYRVASIIPMGLLMIPGAVLKADFVTMAQNRNNRHFLWNYFIRFGFYFLIFGLVLLAGVYFFGEYFLQIFGKDYYKSNPLLLILLAGTVMAMILRNPLGNMLSALGKAKFNMQVTVATIILNIVLNYVLISKLGTYGAAWATFTSLVFTGLCLLVYFLFYLKSLKDQD